MWVDWSEIFCSPNKLPARIPKLFVWTLKIGKNLPLRGSVGLGYEWLVLLPSKAQVKVKELSSSLTISPFWNPWLAQVISNTPVVTLNAVPDSAVLVVGAV